MTASTSFAVVRAAPFALFVVMSMSQNQFSLPTRRMGENGAWDEIPEIHSNSSGTAYVVSKLLPFTVYSFRILAVNKLGVSGASKESYYICTLREGE
jgi:hypothetical protein